MAVTILENQVTRNVDGETHTLKFHVEKNDHGADVHYGMQSDNGDFDLGVMNLDDFLVELYGDSKFSPFFTFSQRSDLEELADSIEE